MRKPSPDAQLNAAEDAAHGTGSATTAMRVEDQDELLPGTPSWLSFSLLDGCSTRGRSSSRPCGQPRSAADASRARWKAKEVQGWATTMALFEEVFHPGKIGSAVLGCWSTRTLRRPRKSRQREERSAHGVDGVHDE